MVENFFPDQFTYKRLEILDIPEADLLSSLPACIDFISHALKPRQDQQQQKPHSAERAAAAHNPNVFVHSVRK